MEQIREGEGRSYHQQDHQKPVSQIPFLVRKVEKGTNQTSKKWFVLAIIVGSVVLIGGGTLGALGLLHSHGMLSLPKWLSSAVGTIGHTPHFWSLWALTGGSVVLGGGLIAVGAVKLHQSRIKPPLIDKKSGNNSESQKSECDEGSIDDLLKKIDEKKSSPNINTNEAPLAPEIKPVEKPLAPEIKPVVAEPVVLDAVSIDEKGNGISISSSSPEHTRLFVSDKRWPEITQFAEKNLPPKTYLTVRFNNREYEDNPYNSGWIRKDENNQIFINFQINRKNVERLGKKYASEGHKEFMCPRGMFIGS